MATIIVRHASPGDVIFGTAGADTFILDGTLGVTVFGLGGNDDIRAGIPNPAQLADPRTSYTTIYGDGAVRGSPWPNALEGDYGGRDAIAGGYGYILKAGPGTDRYEIHGNAPNGPLIASIPQIDIDRDTLFMDRSDDHRWADGIRAFDWDVIRLDGDTFRVRGVTLHAFSENPIVRDQFAELGFLPTGHGERHHYFDVPAETPHEALAEANHELHAMAHAGDFLI